MLWFLNPLRTCQVLNRIANQSFKHYDPSTVHQIMDQAQELLWRKVDKYYGTK